MGGEMARRRGAGAAWAAFALALCALGLGVAYRTAAPTSTLSFRAALVTDDASQPLDDGGDDDGPDASSTGLEHLSDDVALRDDNALEDSRAEGVGERPDVVLVTLDDVGMNDLWESTDLPVLTHIPSLVAEGVELTAYYGQSLCSPARAALMSGKFVHKIGFSDQWGPKREVTAFSNYSVPLGHVLMPEALKRVGYGTHMIGKWNIGHCNEAYMPYMRGFDTFAGYLTDGISYTEHVADGPSTYYFRNEPEVIRDFTFYDEKGGVPRNGSRVRGEYTTSIFNSRAVSILKGVSPEAPLFLWLAHHGMHDNEGVDDADTCAEVDDEDDNVVFTLGGSLTRPRYRFACALKAIDRGVGAMRTALDARPRPYVLVVHSDNGGWPCSAHCAGNNYPRRGSKFFDFEGGVRVPGVVYSPTLIPDARRGAAYDGLMHHVDWLATFVGLGGGNATALDPTYDSVDHWAHISGASSTASPRSTIIFAASANTAAVRSGDYKLMHHMLNASYFHTSFNGTTDSHPWACNSNEMETYFFDVVSDPTEQIDLSLDPGYAEERDVLNAIWIKAFEDDFWVPSWPFDTLSPGTPQAERAEDAIHANGGYVTHWGCQAHLRN